MKTVLVGGGRGCLAILKMLVHKRLTAFSPEVLGVVDPDLDAPGIVFARKRGWPVFSNIEDALALDGLELVIEVTGLEEVREQVARSVAGRIRVMDSQMARIFWDLDEMARNLREELKKKTALEVEIKEDRRSLQDLLDSLPDSVMVLDEDGRIKRVNRCFEQVTKLSWNDVRNTRCRDLCETNSRCENGGEICAFRRALETEGPVTVVQHNSCIRTICEDGDCFYQTIANPIRNSAGEINVVVTSREVTRQIRLARETEELARRARQILDTVHGIITITDLDGNLQFINPSAIHFFGLKDMETEGKNLGELLPADVAEVFRRNDETIIQKGDHLSQEEVIVLNGTEYILITERLLLLDYKENPIAICRVSRNVTVARRLRQEMIASEKHAAVGKLAAGVAHELNNPLTGILTFSEEILEDTEDDSPIHEDVRVIMRETLRCRRIVRDLLDLSRQSVTDRKVISINPTVERTLKLVQKQAAFHDIQFDIDLNDEVLHIYADPNQLQQVVLNLIINARDAMNGKGNLTIVARRVDKADVLIEIRDRGCGISPDDLGKIFDPFFSTKGDKGNGLGLAAVQSIVEEHGGTISVESVVGEGTTFRVVLPAAKRADNDRSSRTKSILPAYHDWDES
ncbi:MAG: PAS domain-containing protein [Deltaproteobacteria bacterium]|nr:PAS domain-containing protein [Deltaproteobacteria bacterium]